MREVDGGQALGGFDVVSVYIGHGLLRKSSLR